MTRLSLPLWIAPAEGGAAQGACAACLRPAPAPASSMPAQMLGDLGAARRVLAALRSVIDPENGLDMVASGWVHALRVAPDEAELTLHSRASGCSVANALAEDAFAVLRSELPDTDLYIRHLRNPAGAANGRQCQHPLTVAVEA